MNDIPMVDVYFWSDGTWCLREEYSTKEYSWKSANFGQSSFPITTTNLEIDEAVAGLVS